MACRILVPQPGVEPTLPSVEVGIPNHWTAWQFLRVFFVEMSFGQNRVFGDSQSHSSFAAPTAAGARFLWVPTLLLHLPRFLLDLIEFKGDVRFLKYALRIINTYSPSLIRFLSFTFNTHIPYFSDFEASKHCIVSNIMIVWTCAGGNIFDPTDMKTKALCFTETAFY